VFAAAAAAAVVVVVVVMVVEEVVVLGSISLLMCVIAHVYDELSLHCIGRC
jgi:hypothetical protein